MTFLLAQDAPAMLLDTLVKLASLGASGVCVLAIFWVPLFYVLVCSLFKGKRSKDVIREEAVQ